MFGIEQHNVSRQHQPSTDILDRVNQELLKLMSDLDQIGKNEKDLSRRISVLKALGADINQTMLLTAEHGNLKGITTMLGLGANINHTDDNHDSALTWAACSCSRLPENYQTYVSIVKQLIEHDADIDHQNSEGESALISAAQTDNIEMVKYLLGQGANHTLINEDGQTALDLALVQEEQSEAIIDMLQQAPAQPAPM
jgi:ankyrin repeat protein